MEEAVLTRVYAVADPSHLDRTYAEGLRAAITAAVEYGLAVVEAGEERSPLPPPILLAQARLAARHGIGLDTVLRRYFAGHALLGDFLVAEAGRSGLREAELRQLLRVQAALFDRLVAAVSEEYAREAPRRTFSSERRRVERIERLLAGEMIEVSEFQYDFAGSHVAVITQGEGASEELVKLASAVDRRLLTIRREDGTLWAWLGGRSPIDLDRLWGLLNHWPRVAPIAIGEPGEGLAGWRLSHRQAQAALPVAVRGPEARVRYLDVALLASMLQDDLLTTSLRMLYLEPLEAERDGGETLRQTLRAYFAANRNVSSAAARLGVSRQAVAKRLRACEEKLDRSLDLGGVEMEAALRLGDLDLPKAPRAASDLWMAASR